MNTGEILRAAAARVREQWGQGDIFGHCALSHVHGVLGGEELYLAYFDPQVRKVASIIAGSLKLRPSGILADELSHDCGAVVCWNDDKKQTAENVAAGLEYAAVIWDQEQAIEQASSVGAVDPVGEQVAVGPRA